MHANMMGEVSVFGDDVAQTILPEFRALYQYWAGVKGERWAPPWTEFHLYRVPLNMVPWCVVVDVHHDPLNFIYRFWGTQIRDLTKVELTGKSVDDIPNKSYAERARKEYSEILEYRTAMFSNMAHTDTNGMKSRYQALRVPFSSGSEVESILSVGGYSRLPETEISNFTAQESRRW